ncbi:nuclear transport factor 2 family protein [Brevibacterium spongiae]|uniref:Nuclear transport factor 2 family protein n=1 Tax=Brevibacterium spongiae TaxID=2909672 RepID=A0ABY5SQX3_9MICO|nr:nuclear transport factor 2 family protein [Brevibacterium spongiae]UVI36947.1 nuclear transport factor 2 family protein [Brevibacterium spongiae]
MADRHIAAFNAGDVDALLADFADSATWVTGDYTIAEGGLREFFTEAMQALLPQLSLRRVIDGGSVIAVEMREDWSHQGENKSAGLIAVFDLVDSKIAKAKIYREGSADA